MATFDAASHTYTVDGHVAPRSVTALVKTQFPFDPTQIIAANYRKWKAENNAKYAEHYDKPDDEAKMATVIGSPVMQPIMVPMAPVYDKIELQRLLGNA